VLKDKIKPKIDHSKRILNKPGELALTDDPKWREEETKRVKEGLQTGLTIVKLSTAQIIRALGQNEKLDRSELESAMVSLVEQLDEMATLANLHSALQSDNSVKDTVTQLCTDLDGMFNEVADIFKKKILNTEPKKELCEAAQKVGETSDWLLYRLRPDLADSQRAMRVNELAGEVALQQLLLVRPPRR